MDQFRVTRENLLVKVPEEQYEKGFLVFTTTKGQETELGKLKVIDYRGLQKEPYREPLVYLMQAMNLLYVICRLAAMFIVCVPAFYFWAFVFFLHQSGENIDLNQLRIVDLFSPPLIFAVSVLFILFMLFFTMFRDKLPGYVNFFERRFRRILEGKLPALRGLNDFKIRWQS
jgi:hypothetical protein